MFYYWGCGGTGMFIHCQWGSRIIPPLWGRIWQYLTKLHMHLSLDHRNPPSRNLLWSCSSNNMKTHVHRVIHFSVICPCKILKLPKSLSIGYWLNKIWYVHTMEYCVGYKTNWKNRMREISLNWYGMISRKH